MFKYLWYGMIASFFVFFLMALFSACTMYSIKMDHPADVEFENNDKRAETDTYSKHKRARNL